jgi:hypothetical protein
MPDRGYTLIDVTPPPGLWPDRDRVVRFMEHVRANFHCIVQGVPPECELDLLASGHAHNPGLLPLLALWTPDASLDRLPHPDRMTVQVTNWCSSLPPHEVERIVATTAAPTWEELVCLGVHPPRKDNAS